MFKTSKDGSVVKVGAFLGSISDNKANVSVKEVKNTRNENNVIILDASKKEPKIFEEKSNREKPLILTDEEEKPLILRDQILEENLTDQKKDNQALSPAVRKIVTENKIDLEPHDPDPDSTGCIFNRYFIGFFCSNYCFNF